MPFEIQSLHVIEKRNNTQLLHIVEGGATFWQRWFVYVKDCGTKWLLSVRNQVLTCLKNQQLKETVSIKCMTNHVPFSQCIIGNLVAVAILDLKETGLRFWQNFIIRKWPSNWGKYKNNNLKTEKKHFNNT